ncbi:MAG: hypothetical protein LJE83_15140 [Gammaproteobacteria bacterium]|nr:hypothetical protein [Gammaproteobacteria bacterium]
MKTAEEYILYGKDLRSDDPSVMSNSEASVSGMSALDELKAFLGETVSKVSSEAEDKYRINDGQPSEFWHSILEELQSLLWECIDELTASLESDSGVAMTFASDSPGHDELKDLLETSLLQLMNILDDPESADYIAEGASVLDELSEILGVTESNNDSDASTISVTDEIDEPGSSLESEQGISDDNPGTTSVTDKGDTDYTAIEEDDELTNNESEKLVLDEYAAYIDGSLDLLTIAAENLADEAEPEPVPDDEDISSDSLAQMEARLKQSLSAVDDESGNKTELENEAFITDEDTAKLSTDSDKHQEYRQEEQQHEVWDDDYTVLINRTQHYLEKTESATQNALDKAKNKTRMPFVAMSLLAATVTGAAVYWYLSGNPDEQTNHTGPGQSGPAEVTVIEKPASLEKETIAPVQAETKAVVAAVAKQMADETNEFDAFFVNLGTIKNKTKALNDRGINSATEADLSPTPQDEAENTITENRIRQLIYQQIKQAQANIATRFATSEENADLISKRLAAAETSIAKIKRDIEKMQLQKSVQSVQVTESTMNSEHQTGQMQDENNKNPGLLNDHVNEAESSIKKLQHAAEDFEKLVPVRSVASISSEMNAAHALKLSAGDVTDQTYTIWSVHLLSYYGNPPPAGELAFLDRAGVPYEIEKTIVNDGIWYRVLVNNSTDYTAAREYADMLKARLRLKKIWISKKQYTYE